MYEPVRDDEEDGGGGGPRTLSSHKGTASCITQHADADGQDSRVQLPRALQSCRAPKAASTARFELYPRRPAGPDPNQAPHSLQRVLRPGSLQGAAGPQRSGRQVGVAPGRVRAAAGDAGCEDNGPQIGGAAGVGTARVPHLHHDRRVTQRRVARLGQGHILHASLLGSQPAFGGEIASRWHDGESDTGAPGAARSRRSDA